MTIYNWIQLSLVCLMGAASPGPSLALIMHNAISKSRINGIIASIGHGIGIVLYACITVTGLEILIITYSETYNILRILGLCFLILIGLQIFINSKNIEIEKNINQKNLSTSSFIQGFLISFLNPKILVYFIAIYSQFIQINSSFIEKTFLVIIPGIIDTAWYSIVSIIVTLLSVQKFINKRKAYIEKIIGIFIILIAITLILNFNKI